MNSIYLKLKIPQLNRQVFRIIFLLVIILRGGGTIVAQTTLQVVTKIIDKNMPCAADAAFALDADKADIIFKTDAKSREIKIHIELIARHQRLETAKNDLNALKIVVEDVGGKIFVRNYTAIEKGANKPTADLRVRYTITLPPTLSVTLKNTFGKLNIADFTNKLDITAEFCKIQLSNIKAKISLNTRFGNIEGDMLDDKIYIASNRTDIVLKSLKGTCVINAQFGKIEVNAAQNLTYLQIKAEKSDVFFSAADDITKFGYTLVSEYGNVKTPAKVNFSYPEKTKERQRAYFNNKATANINIQTRFGQIVIQ